MPRVPYVEKLRSWKLLTMDHLSAGSGNCYCKTLEITSGVRRAARLVGPLARGEPVAQEDLRPAEAKETANAEIKELYEGFDTQFGMRGVPNVAKALANSPGLATGVFPLAN